MEPEDKNLGLLNNNFASTDKAIEADVRRLKQSSYFLAILGTLALILVFVALIYAIYYRGLANKELVSPPNFISFVFVTSDNADIFSAPDDKSESVGKFTKGESLFLLEKQDDWFKVHREQSGKDPELEGWIHRDNIETRDEIVARRENITEAPIEIYDIKWIVDEIDNFTIIGWAKNKTDIPLRNVRIAIEFYDENSNLVNRELTNVTTDKPLIKGQPRSFFSTGKYKGHYNYVRYTVESFN